MLKQRSVFKLIQVRHSLALISSIALLLACAAPALGQSQPPITREIRYDSAEAGAVALVWGVDGWQPLPESLRPPETTLLNEKGQIMRTPMALENGVFVARVRVPAGTRINYIFQISKTRSGISIDAWDMGDQPEQEFQIIANQDGTTTVKASVAIAQQMYTSTHDSQLQLVGTATLLAAALLLAVIALRMHFRNPYLDF
jgi:hypothetical protein